MAPSGFTASLLRVPVLGRFARWSRDVIRIGRTNDDLTRRLDQLGRSVEELHGRFEVIEKILPGIADSPALDVAALRNQVESLPVELTALRRDLERLSVHR